MPHSLMPAHDKWSGNLITHAVLWWLMRTFKYITIYSSFIISAFKKKKTQKNSELVCVTVWKIKKPQNNAFVNYFFPTAAEINPDDVTESVWECMSCDLEFQMWSYKLRFIFDGVIEHEFFTRDGRGGERGGGGSVWFVFISLCILHSGCLCGSGFLSIWRKFSGAIWGKYVYLLSSQELCNNVADVWY